MVLECAPRLSQSDCPPEKSPFSDAQRFVNGCKHGDPLRPGGAGMTMLATAVIPREQSERPRIFPYTPDLHLTNT